MTRAKRLTNLDVTEISGVDHPANLMEGWLVMKSRGGTCPDCNAPVVKGTCSQCGYVQKERQVSMNESDLQEILEKAAEFQTAHEGLDESLQNVQEYLTEAPEEVQAALGVLQKHVTIVLEKDDDSAVSPDDTKGRFAKFLTGLFKAESEELEDDDEELEELEELTEEDLAAAGWEPVDVNPAEEFHKAWSDMCKSIADGDNLSAATVFDEEIIPILEENEDMEEFVKALVEELRKAIQPEEAEGTTEAEATAEAETELTKAREDADATRTALEKALERIEKLEGNTATRRSVEGQEAAVEKAEDKPTLDHAVEAALNGAKVTIN